MHFTVMNKIINANKDGQLLISLNFVVNETGPSSHGHVLFKKPVVYICGRSCETFLGLLCEAFPMNSHLQFL